MFLLISFVLGNNYCVGTSYSCSNLCKSLINTFDGYYSNIPTDDDLNATSNSMHNIFISTNVDYAESNQTIIFCYPSFYYLNNNHKKIKIKDQFFFFKKKLNDDAPISFRITSSISNDEFSIEVMTKEECNIKPFILECHYNSLVHIKFCTENIPENLITIKKQYSYNFYLPKISDNVRKLFSNPDQFKVQDMIYYCLSDKEEKCKDYSSFKPQYIDYPSQITRYPCYLIVDHSKPQILVTEKQYCNYYSCYSSYVHIICLSGSDITYYPGYQMADRWFNVILHQNSIEMPNLYFEGDGEFTISTTSNISLYSTTKTNNNHLTLKSRHPYYYSESYIHALREDLTLEIDNKIKIHEYSLFNGPKCLAGLFEPGKYLSDDVFITYNVTADTLVETEYDYVTYMFKEGVHEIPKTWKSRCRFQGINPNNTHFIFDDVYSYDGDTIDNFIDVNRHPSSGFNMITIKPADFFYLSSFRSVYRPEYIDKYVIQVNKDFVMDGRGPNSNLDDDEIAPDQCIIKGNGTINFISSSFMDDVEKYCQIDENITLNYIGSRYPKYYVCLGQSSEEKCKSEIHGVENIKNAKWLWLRNIRTRYYLYSYYQTYVTDKYYYHNLYYSIFNVILTANSEVIIPYSKYGRFSINENAFSSLVAQNRTAKVIILYDDGYNGYLYDDSYTKQILYIENYQPPTEIDFQINLYYGNIKLYMRYYKNYKVNSIKLRGKGQVYIREPYQSIIDIFDTPETIKFSLNNDYDYSQICLSDEPIESKDLYDFVLCSNYEQFKEYDSKYHYANAFIYLDISLDFNNSRYYCDNFYFFRNITASISLPNNAIFVIEKNYFELTYDYNHRFYSNDKNDQNKFIFDVKEKLILNSIKVNSNTPLIEFTSSKESVELLPNPSIQKVTDTYKIKIPDDFTVYAPVPSYINHLFEKEVQYSSNWAYYYSSEEGKKLFGSFQSNPFEAIKESDENVPENIVLAVGENDNVIVPSNWMNLHNIYLYQSSNNYYIYKPTNLTYLTDGVIINDNFKIIAGVINISVPENFTVNADIPYGHHLRHYLYDSVLDCNGNSNTNLYTGSIDVNSITEDGYTLIEVYGYDSDNILKIVSKNSQEMSDLNMIMYLITLDNVKFRFDYDNICYCSYSNYLSKCPGKFHHVTDLTGLFKAVLDYPELTVNVYDDLIISHTTGDYFKLNSCDENVLISLPYSPQSMTTTTDQTVLFNYSDSTVYEILNKAYIDVNLDEPLEINIESDTSSSISFSLDDDVFVTMNSKCDVNFKIDVDKNSHHLYIEDFNTYNNIFNGSLEPYIKICAYDSSALSSCSYPRNDIISEVFKEPFVYNEVEIALTSNPQEITIPSTDKEILVNILPVPASFLTVNTASSIHITPNSVVLNDYWFFGGNVKILTVKLNKMATISIIDEMTDPITLQLTDNHTFIDLKNCDKQNISQITLLKHGNETNEITIFGNNDTYHNFINSLVEYEGITIIHNGTQKYLCICNNEESCTRCKEGLEGIVIEADSIINDPGEDVPMRIFSNIEMSSELFINEHEVYIDANCKLNITNVKTVNQNIEEGLKVDNLLFVNGTNLLLKPREIALNIVMRKEEKGPYFTIEIDTFLRLNVSNSKEENIKSSRLHVEGKGELNTYDYPFERIRPGPYVKVIKGVYIICNPRSGKDVCSYESSYGYMELDHTEGFRSDFDPYSKIVVFLNSFRDILDANVNWLQQQQIVFIKQRKKSRELLDDEQEAKVRFISTNFVLSSTNSTELSNSEGGGTVFDSTDLDSIIVGFDDNLTIKQDGELASNSSSLTIQPMSEKVSVFIDDSYEIEKQKLKIESNNDKKVSVTIRTNKNITSEELNKYIESDKNKISVTIGDQSSSKKGLPIGAIVGIVVGDVAVVAVVVVIVLFVVKKKKGENIVLSEVNNDLSDSTF